MRKLLLCLVLVFSFNCIFLADYNTVYANDDYLIESERSDNNDGFFAKTVGLAGMGAGVVVGAALTYVSSGSFWPTLITCPTAGLSKGISVGRKIDNWFKK